MMNQLNLPKIKVEDYLPVKKQKKFAKNKPYVLEKINGLRYIIEIGYKSETVATMQVNHIILIVINIHLGVMILIIQHMEMQLGTGANYIF